jgi:hypothetical protein
VRAQDDADGDAVRVVLWGTRSLGIQGGGGRNAPGLNYAASFSAFLWPLMRLRTVSEGWAPFEIQ